MNDGHFCITCNSRYGASYYIPSSDSCLKCREVVIKRKLDGEILGKLVGVYNFILDAKIYNGYHGANNILDELLKEITKLQNKR